MQSASLAVRLRRSAATCALLAAVCAPAFAQNTPQTPPPPVDNVQPPEQSEQDSEDRVVVTGSRIPRNAFTSTAPIQVITAEASTLEGLVDTTEILQGSSVAQGSVQLNNTFGNFVVEGGPGINSVSLRGLGAQRSLVLLNSQRPGPAGARGQVGAFDLNVVPDSIISRVEILKDGASSIYGSDAVAGVANIITRSSVDAPELNIQYNATEEGGGNTLQVNGAIGFDILGGHVMLAGEYEDRDPLKLKDRKNFACANDLIFDPVTGQRLDRIDQSILRNTELANCAGNLYHNTVVDAFSGLRYVPSPDGVVSGPIPGYRPRANRTFLNSPTGYAYYEDVLNSPKFGEGYAVSGTERTSLYGRADFRIFGGVEWTTEALLTRRETEQKAWRQYFPQIASANGYDVPGSFTAQGFAQVDLGFGPFQLTQPVTIWPSDQWVTVDYSYINSGLKGDFFLPGWTWMLNASYSLSDAEYSSNEIPKETAGDWRYPSPSDGLFHGPAYNPFDPAFLSGNWSQATYDLLTVYTAGTTTYEQTIVQGVLSGDLFELPAGPLGFAVGAEWRNHEIDDVPDELEQNDEIWGSSVAAITRGEDTVVEGFVEVNAPILRGLPLIEELTFEGSARAFEYDSYGSDSVWKAGLNWQVTPTFRIRGTTGTSYRAPALYELFLGNLTGFQDQTLIDPCIDWGNSGNVNIRTNCAAAGVPSDYTGFPGEDALVTQIGGAGLLEAETSEARTLGVIWTPSSLPFSLAVEYFEIDVDNQVAQLGPATILNGCYAAPVFPNAFCDLFVRNAGNDPTAPFNIASVDDSYININSQTTNGVDITLRYEQEFSFGEFSVDLSATNTLEDVLNLFAPDLASGFETNDFNGTVGDPEWVADATIQLRRGDFTYSWFIDFIGSTDNEVFFPEILPGPPGPNYFGRAARVLNRTDDWASHDVSVRWEGDHLTLLGGVTNVFDAQPPVISFNGGQRLQNYALAATQYDVYGRTFFVRLGYKF